MNNQPIMIFPLHSLAYNDAQKVFCGELHKRPIYRKLSRKDKKDAWRKFRYAIMIEDLKELNLMSFLGAVNED